MALLLGAGGGRVGVVLDAGMLLADVGGDR
jgi:hypothetical protein